MRILSLLAILVAVVFWGFGFVAAIFAMHDMGPFFLTVIRFSMALGVSLLISAVLTALGFQNLRSEWNLKALKLSFLPGILVGITIIFQTWGLRYTSAGRSGFLTGLYVVFVPFVERYLFHKHFQPTHILLVALALAGTGLIVGVGAGAWNLGDFLTLVGAFAATFQISWLGQVSRQVSSVMVFNSLQCLWAALLALPFALIFEAWPKMPSTGMSWVGVLGLGLGSTWLAFALQVYGQRRVPASLASLLFLLESPLALIFAFLLLAERFSIVQCAGAALILVASYAAIRLETRHLALIGAQGILNPTRNK